MTSMLHLFISFVIIPLTYVQSMNVFYVSYRHALKFCDLVMCGTVPNESISSHVLNTVTGEPAEDLAISAYIQEGMGWKVIGETRTGKDGRVPWVSPNFTLRKGTYKILFEVEDYFKRRNMDSFYPYVEVVFKVDDPSRHYHIPLTLSPYSYSTYRGS
ncbi:hydroxyisourate hydrolase [Cooperia oncophora]